MTIPRFNKFGHLPVGIYNCTLCEIERRFGSFQDTDYRVKLFRRLENFIEEVRDTGYVSVLIINGSFVTRSPRPNDIDLIL